MKKKYKKKGRERKVERHHNKTKRDRDFNAIVQVNEIILFFFNEIRLNFIIFYHHSFTHAYRERA